jgi:hypothetical protein
MKSYDLLSGLIANLSVLDLLLLELVEISILQVEFVLKLVDLLALLDLLRLALTVESLSPSSNLR